MKIDIVRTLANEVYVIYAPGIGWLKADNSTGILNPLTQDQVIVDVMRRGEVLRNKAKEDLVAAGVTEHPAGIKKAAFDKLTPEQQELVERWRFWESVTDSGFVQSGLTALKGLVTDTEPFDADKWLLGTPSGVLDLQSGRVLDPAAAAERRVTKKVAVHPAKSVTPEFLAVMEAIPAEQREYVRWHLARSLVAEMARYMFIHTGTGANGKSLVIGCLYHSLGAYATQVDAAALSGGSAGYHLARLRGARFAYLEELEADAAVKPTLWKTLAATPSITARDIYKEVMTFANTWTVAVNTNFTPTVDTGDGGVARRAKIIPWPFRYCENPTEPHERPVDITDPDGWVFDKANQAQMLRWLIDVVNDPEPVMPECLKGAREDWHEQNDVVGQFVAECCDLGPDYAVRSIAVGEAFGRWLTRKGYHQQGERVRLKKLNSWVAQHKGTERSKKETGAHYLGLDLKFEDAN